MKKNGGKEMKKTEEKKDKVYQKPTLAKYRQLKKAFSADGGSPIP